MSQDLVATPADAVQTSGVLRFVLQAVCKSAEICKYWDQPSARAATAFEEMTLLDKIYWVYKCAHPIIRPERGATVDALCGAEIT